MPAFDGGPCCDVLRRPLGPLLHTFFMNVAPFYSQKKVDWSRSKVDHVQHHLEHYSESIFISPSCGDTLGGHTRGLQFLCKCHTDQINVAPSRPPLITSEPQLYLHLFVVPSPT